MPYIFDGQNLLITLPPGTAGVGQLDAKDIYSAWKAWVLVGDNAKYPPAFRTIGGDPLSSIINVGAYYFLRNDFGWRIKPAEEDVNYYLIGNLAAEDTSQPILIPTTGPYTVAIFGLQPVTQGVTPTMAEQIESGTDHIHDIWQDMGLDPENPTSYTDDGTTTTKISGDITLEITDSTITRI